MVHRLSFFLVSDEAFPLLFPPHQIAAERGPQRSSRPWSICCFKGMVSFLKGVIAKRFCTKTSRDKSTNWIYVARLIYGWSHPKHLWKKSVLQASFITIPKTHSWLSSPDGPEVLRIVTQISVLIIGMLEHFKLDERLEIDIKSGLIQ